MEHQELRETVASFYTRDRIFSIFEKLMHVPFLKQNVVKGLQIVKTESRPLTLVALVYLGDRLLQKGRVDEVGPVIR